MIAIIRGAGEKEPLKTTDLTKTRVYEYLRIDFHQPLCRGYDYDRYIRLPEINKQIGRVFDRLNTYTVLILAFYRLLIALNALQIVNHKIKKTMQDTAMENIQGHWDNLMASAIAWAPRIITAIVSALLIYLIGSWLIRLVKRFAAKSFEHRKLDTSLQRFLNNLISWVLNILLFIVIITQLGVQTSVFVAIIGAAGLAIGLALQGSLANFAGGVLILVLKPFRVGDYIASSSGVSGTVTEIDIFNTKLNTPQNQLVVAPNGELSNSSVTNYTQMGTRRTWFDIRVPYSADLNQAKNILLAVIKNNEHAYSEPAPQVMVTELGDSAVNLSVRVTTANENFWAMQEQLMMDCKAALDAAGIEIPFPQWDVHLHQKG